MVSHTRTLPVATSVWSEKMESILKFFKPVSSTSERSEQPSCSSAVEQPSCSSAVGEQPSSSSAVLEDISSEDSDCEVGPSASSEPPCKQRKHAFQICWLKTWPWLRYNVESDIMYCDWCIQSKKKNTFVSGSQNFRTSTFRALNAPRIRGIDAYFFYWLAPWYSRKNKLLNKTQ